MSTDFSLAFPRTVYQSCLRTDAPSVLTSGYVMSTAAALSSLSSLKISITLWPERLQNPTVPPLRDFKNLSSFSISCSDNGLPSAYPLRDEIAAPFNASPSLASLGFSSWNVDGGGFTSVAGFSRDVEARVGTAGAG
jgi:hypothetical protein